MKKNFWSDFSWITFFIVLIILLKMSVIGLYLIPSPSMLPNLQPGDRIITNKLAYGLTLPFMENQIWQWSIPKRGDIILFSFENNTNFFIKRVIGLPGDLITFHQGIVYINHSPLSLNIKDNNKEKNLNLFEEKNENYFDKNHFIYLSKDPDQTFFESRRFLVPPGKIFVLGDNRDHSADSRVYGYVDFKRVYGRMSFTLF